MFLGSLHTSKYDGVVLGLVLAYSVLSDKINRPSTQDEIQATNDDLNTTGVTSRNVAEERRGGAVISQLNADPTSSKSSFCCAGQSKCRAGACLCFPITSKKHLGKENSQLSANRKSGQISTPQPREPQAVTKFEQAGWGNGLDIDLRGIEFSEEVC